MAGKRDAFEDLSPEQRLKMADMKAEGIKGGDLTAEDVKTGDVKTGDVKTGDDVGLDASSPKGMPVTDDELAPERPVDGIFKFVVPEDADIKGDGYNVESPDPEGFDIAVDKVSAGEVEADSLYVSGADPAIDELAPLDGPDEIVGDLSGGNAVMEDSGWYEGTDGDDGLDV